MISHTEIKNRLYHSRLVDWFISDFESLIKERPVEHRAWARDCAAWVMENHNKLPKDRMPHPYLSECRRGIEQLKSWIQQDRESEMIGSKIVEIKKHPRYRHIKLAVLENGDKIEIGERIPDHEL